MKPYLLRNNDRQHSERLAIEKWHEEETGDKVDYKTILHALQHKEFIRISKSPSQRSSVL